MTETTQQPAAKALVEDRTFLDLLKAQIGHVVTMVNPESYEDAPVGHQIRVGFYRAKVLGVGNDYLIVATELHHPGRQTKKEPVRQYIPILKIKRVSILKAERLIHL